MKSGIQIKSVVAILAASIIASVCSVHLMAAEEVLPPGIISKEEPRTFVETVNKINATPAFFKALAEAEDNGPVINLNFLRYRPRGDGSRYSLYAAAAGPAVLAVGGDVLLHAAVNIDHNAIFEMSDEWDSVAYVIYPRRAAYIELQRDEGYQLAIPDRVAGNYERMLYVLSDGDPIYKTTGTILNFHETNTRIAVKDGNVVLSELLRFNKSGGRAQYEKFAAAFQTMAEAVGAEFVLSVNAEMPVVSEEYWDHFISIRFPSLDVMQRLYRSDDFLAINLGRINSVEATLSVLSNPKQLGSKPGH